MSRDPRKLRVYQLADELAIEVYRISDRLPQTERYGLQSQMRRAAVSSAVNIVEGCARRGEGEYLQFINIATGFAAETQNLLALTGLQGLTGAFGQRGLGFWAEAP